MSTVLYVCRSHRSYLTAIMPRHIDDVHLQQTVIKYIAHHLGEEAFFCFEGCQLKTKLESVLRDAKRLIVPTATTQTLRRWWYHFTKYGDTQAERRHNKKKEKKKGSSICLCLRR